MKMSKYSRSFKVNSIENNKKKHKKNSNCNELNSDIFLDHSHDYFGSIMMALPYSKNSELNQMKYKSDQICSFLQCLFLLKAKYFYIIF